MADKQEESTLVPKIDLQEIGGGFVKQYYDLFANDRTKLETYYRDPSCLSYEGKHACQYFPTNMMIRCIYRICQSNQSNTIPRHSMFSHQDVVD